MPFLLLLLLIVLIPIFLVISFAFWLFILAAVCFLGLLVAAIACFANGLPLAGISLLVVDVIFLFGGIAFLKNAGEKNND